MENQNNEFEKYEIKKDQIIEVEHNEVTTDNTVQDLVNEDTIEELNDDEDCIVENVISIEEE